MNANNHVVDILENNTTKINILGVNVVRFFYNALTYTLLKHIQNHFAFKSSYIIIVWSMVNIAFPNFCGDHQNWIKNPFLFS